MAGQNDASDATQRPPAASTDLKQPGRIDVKRANQAAVDYLVGSGMTSSDAQMQVKNQPQYAKTASNLRAELPDDIQSIYINDDGKLVANVVTEKGAAKAREAGVTPRQVSSSWDELQNIQKDLLASVTGGVAGLMVGIDPKTSSVKVTYSAGSEEDVAPLLAKARQYGDAVTVTKNAGKLQLTADVNAGSEFNGVGQPRCTVGWAVDIDLGAGKITDGFMTAGHCLTNNTGIEFNGTFAGTGFDVHVGPEGDFGMVILGTQDRHDFFSQPRLASGQPITLVNRNPVVGAAVCKLGIATDSTCGLIEGLNVTVTVPKPDGTDVQLQGMINTNFCAEGGDSGSPVFEPQGDPASPTAVTAVGIASVSSLDQFGNCGENENPPTDNVTIVQPIDAIVPDGGTNFIKISGG